MKKITKMDVAELFLNKYSLEFGGLKVLKFKKLSKPNSLEVSMRDEGSSPLCVEAVNFSFLKKVSALFQTDKIDVDDWSKSGCETCDHGSDFGHSFQIYEAGVDFSELFDEQ